MKNSVKKVLPKYFFSLFICLFISVNIFSTNIVSHQLSAVKSILNEDDRIKTIFLNSAKIEFKRNNWKEAKYAFYNYLLLDEESSPQRLEALYLYAKSCLNASDYLNAILAYSEYLSQCNHEEGLRIVAEWDRAIAAIEIDRELAYTFLGNIAYDHGNQYYKEARELMRLL